MNAREGLRNTIVLAMERRGITRSELARRIGRSRPQVTQMLSGNANMCIDTVETIFKAMGVGVSLELDFKEPNNGAPNDRE